MTLEVKKKLENDQRKSREKIEMVEMSNLQKIGAAQKRAKILGGSGKCSGQVRKS